MQVSDRQQTEAAAKSEPVGEGQAEERVSIAFWVARCVHRMVTFPLWAHQAFTPVGQRLYLNPSGDFAPGKDLMPSLEDWKSKI